MVREAEARMPAEVAGALVGSKQTLADGQEWTTVRAVAPVALEHIGVGLVLDVVAWEALKLRLASERNPVEHILGWFYADPGLGIFPPRLDVAKTHALLLPTGGLLLLVNPATEQNACYVCRDERFVGIEVFTEQGTRAGGKELKPWDGKRLPAPEWLRVAPQLDLAEGQAAELQRSRPDSDLPSEPASATPTRSTPQQANGPAADGATPVLPALAHSAQTESQSPGSGASVEEPTRKTVDEGPRQAELIYMATAIPLITTSWPGADEVTNLMLITEQTSERTPDVMDRVGRHAGATGAGNPETPSAVRSDNGSGWQAPRLIGHEIPTVQARMGHVSMATYLSASLEGTTDHVEQPGGGSKIRALHWILAMVVVFLAVGLLLVLWVLLLHS